MIQNSQAMPGPSTIGPTITVPSEPPMPKIALSAATVRGIQGSGRAARTTPNASGKAPPEMPWTARPAITVARECPLVPSAATTVPTVKQHRQAISTRR